jgi:hypothetical protein
MEGCMTEEQITKAIISWLEQEGWEIICFDFPQSGTGKVIHPNEQNITSKNKGSFIPDIVAIKDEIVIFFENKDRFVLDDFLKVEELGNSDRYSKSIQRLLNGYNYNEIYYGVGLPNTILIVKKISENIEKIDFIVLVSIDNSVNVYYEISSIF